MAEHELIGRALVAVAAIALALGTGLPATAQTGTAPERAGDSQSLSHGAQITAPDTVDPGQQVEVFVEGAPDVARIELWGPVTETGTGSEVTASLLAGGTAVLSAPDTSGSYQLRYLDASGKLLGWRALDVAAIPVALSVRTPVVPGGLLDVTWQGPAQPGDRFEIVSAAGAVVHSTPAAGDPAGRNVSQLDAPQERGTYELRYVTDRGAVLRWVRFDVR